MHSPGQVRLVAIAISLMILQHETWHKTREHDGTGTNIQPFVYETPVKTKNSFLEQTKLQGRFSTSGEPNNHFTLCSVTATFQIEGS
jgi:hypothetical protein